MFNIDAVAFLHDVFKHWWFISVQLLLSMMLISSRPIFKIILVGFWGSMKGVTKLFSAAMMLLTLKL
jgi:hypothetical protein